MGVVRLSEKLLKAMAKCYSVNGQTLFTIDNLCDLFPKETKESLSDAAWLLEDDGLVSVFCADDVAYTVTIELSAIRAVSLSRRARSISAKILREVINFLG